MFKNGYEGVAVSLTMLVVAAVIVALAKLVGG
jgi:hypothetical protein